MSVAQHPKFVMRVDREEPVPRLVSINEPESSYSTYNQFRREHTSKSGKDVTPYKKNKNSNTNFYESKEESYFGQENYQTYGQNQSEGQFANNESNPNFDNSTYHENQSLPPSYYTTLRKQLPITEPKNYRVEVIQLQRMLEIEKQQKQQLQQIIKQLTFKSQKLQEVNEHIVERLKEIEKNFVQQKIQQQKQLDQIVKKTVNQVYSDVSQYLANEIQQLTIKLKGEKMTPLLQKKLEVFMESMLQINQNTVEVFKFSNRKPIVQENILTKFLSKSNHDNTNFYGSRLNEFLMEPKENLNQSFLGKSSMRKVSNSPKQERRLINNSYIASHKQRLSPSRLLQATSNKKENYSDKYNAILKRLENVEQAYQKVQKQPEDVHDNEAQGHISFIDHFKTQLYGEKQTPKIQGHMSGAFGERSRPYDTVGDSRNFNFKQFTPSKRKKIFDGSQRSKSKSKF